MGPVRQTALMMTRPGEAAFQERTLPEPGPGDVVVRAQLSSFKHGTEMMAWTGLSPFARRTLDPGLRIFVDRPEGAGFYPLPMGNMFVGEIEWAGAQAGGLAPGTRVFAWGPIADRHVLPAGKAQALGGLSPEQALCIDPASFALGAVLDGAIGSGELVFMTGLGAIGLLAVQYCAARGARVFASSAFTERRALAEKFGAERTYDSAAVSDPARLLKEETGGADAAIECSGRLTGLQRCIRALKPCGRAVCAGFYGPSDGDLNLGEEFFHNRITLLASLPAFGVGNPVRTQPPLYAKDLQHQAACDFLDGTIAADSLIHPVLPFHDAVATVHRIGSAPQTVLKAALRHGAGLSSTDPA